MPSFVPFRRRRTVTPGRAAAVGGAIAAIAGLVRARRRAGRTDLPPPAAPEAADPLSQEIGVVEADRGVAAAGAEAGALGGLAPRDPTPGERP